MHETAENSFENILEKESQPSKDEHVFDFVDVVNGFSKLFSVNPSYQVRVYVSSVTDTEKFGF